jgi:uncharacterized membrane protein HdeD (DUF308 family)
MNGTAARLSGTPWGVLLAIGIVAVVFGLIVIANPFDSLRFVAALIGLFLLIAGIIGVVASVRGRGGTGSWYGPVIAIIGGLILMVVPGLTLQLLAVLVGAILLIWGVVTALQGVRGGGGREQGSVVGGIVLAVLGLVVVAWPSASLSLITLLAGIAILLFGIALIVQAFRLRT